MTEQEFVERYAARSDMTVEELLRLMVPLPCDCGQEFCQGWRMMSKSNHAWEEQLRQRGANRDP